TEQPSGVALVAERSHSWECVAIEPSYATFVDRSKGPSSPWPTTLKGSAPDPDRLLRAATKLLAGESVSLVAVDIPMANIVIDSRRVADDKISSEFGGNWCSTHSPNSRRPGPVGELIKEGFGASRYRLATAD